MSETALLSFSVRLLTIGLIVDTINSLVNYSYYYSLKGIFNLDYLKKINRAKITRRLLSKFDFVFSASNFKFFLYLRLLICLVLFLFPIKFILLIGFLFLLQLLFNLRNKVSLSGADQMRSIMLFGLTLISTGTKELFLIGSLFIVINLYIAYFFTAFHKIRSPYWRNGSALIIVLNSELFGNKFLQKTLIKQPPLINVGLCWLVILFQLTFPVFASFNQTLTVTLLMGFLFHLSLALIMNLNDFFWTFISAYPILYILIIYNGFGL